jgi:antitoxin component of MazEF toxin-antitoxin module
MEQIDFGVRIVYKKGSALGVTIPVVFARNEGISAGTKVRMCAKGRKLILEVVKNDKY